jgi:hypothetical protein
MKAGVIAIGLDRAVSRRKTETATGDGESKTEIAGAIDVDARARQIASLRSSE